MTRPAPDSRAGRRRLLAQGAGAVVVAAAVAWVLHHAWPEPRFGHLDYRIYVTASRRLGLHSIYAFHYFIDRLGFTYPPFAAVVLWPLGRLSNHTGEIVWLFASVAGTVVAAALVVRLQVRRPRWSLYGAVVVAFTVVVMPSRLTFRFGQINALVALLVVVDVWLISRDGRAGGIGIGLAAALKLTPACLVPWLLVTRRRAGLNAIAAFAAAGLAAATVAPRDSWRYWTHEIFATGRVGDLSSSYSNSIRRFLTWVPIGKAPQTAIWGLLCLALAVVAYKRAIDADRRGNILAAVTIVSCFGYLASPIAWGHHLFFLAPAALLVVGDAGSLRRIALAALLAVPLIDPFEGGEGHVWSTVRFGCLLLVVLFLPIDAPAPDDPAAAADRITSGVAG